MAVSDMAIIAMWRFLSRLEPAKLARGPKAGQPENRPLWYRSSTVLRE